MILKNAIIIDENFKRQRLDIRVCNDRIVEIGLDLRASDSNEMEMDYSGCYILPGFIDTHIHGAYGSRISDPEPDIARITRFEASQGVTSIAITTATSLFVHLLRQLEIALEAIQGEPQGAKVMGIHAEGPFINEKRKGAMNAAHIQSPSIDKFKTMMETAEGWIRILTIAPEMEGAEELIRYASACGVKVSLGHTDATYEQANQGIAAGASRGTHTFNAMRSYNHREPGVIGAVLTNPEVDCEMICDYVHLHPATVKLIYQIKGADHISMISDSGNAAGLEVDQFEVDGIVRYVKDGVVRLADGTIAGSAKTLLHGVQNLIRDGIPMGDVAKMASYNPARALGIENETGSIAVGKLADFVVLDEELQVVDTYVNGVRF